MYKMIVVNQNRTFILETKDLWRAKNSIYCNNYTADEFNVKLATYDNDDTAFYVFEDLLKHFTDKEPYYLPKGKTEVEISAEEIKFIDEIDDALSATAFKE